MAATYVDSAAVTANAAGCSLQIGTDLPCTPGNLLLGVAWFSDVVQSQAMAGAVQQALTAAGFFDVTLAQGSFTGVATCTFGYGYRWATGAETSIDVAAPDATARRCGIVCVEVAGATLVDVDTANNDENNASQIIPRTGAVTLAAAGLAVCVVAAVPDDTPVTAPAGWTLGALDALAGPPGGQCAAAWDASAAGVVAAANFGGGGTQVGWRTLTVAFAELATILDVAEVTFTAGGMSTPAGRARYPQPPDDPLDPPTVAWPPDPATGPTVPAYPWGVTKEAG